MHRRDHGRSPRAPSSVTGAAIEEFAIEVISARTMMGEPADTIHLAVVSDATYLEPIGVMLHSLLRWHAPAELRVHWVHLRMDRQALRSARDLADALGVQVEFVAGDAFVRRDNWPPHVNPTILKIYLAEILSEVDRVLYLDGDIVVESSLRPLWQMDLNGKSLAGVRDSWVGSAGFWSDIPTSSAESRSLWMRTDYVNAGVLLYDLARCRTRAVAAECARWMASNRDAHFFEQDALNVVLAGDLLLLPPSWNVLGVAECYLRGAQATSTYSADELAEAYCDPKIIHFAGATKPWGPAAGWQPLAPRYFRARKASPWHLSLTVRQRVHVGILRVVHDLQCRGKLSAAQAILFLRNLIVRTRDRTRAWYGEERASCGM